MSLFNCAISPINALIASFVLLSLTGPCFAQHMSSNEYIEPASRKRHHTHRHLRHTSLRTSAGSTSDAFALNCPHVADANNEHVRIEATWTKDDTIWLKIENGERRIYNKLSSFDKKRIGKKSVLRVTLNKGRYVFGYDELTGDFGMEIRPVIANEDEGIWQCHVTVHQKGNTYTLTSRSRVKNLQRQKLNKDGQRSQLVDESSQLMYDEQSLAEKKDSISSFTRHEKSTIEISRYKKQQAVVFDRRNLPQSSRRSSTDRQMAIVDYEDEDSTNPGYSLSGRHNRKRHRDSSGQASTRRASYTLLVLIITAMLMTR
ncbi:unnamed protein product [Toxocara canis]|uniref:Ig-like domain-containing protein n=1 Tax=Toxocara canis TaxID=6265 RepID=A0A183UU49_TOXCA|nr:unnamed protein product [Toxocara canis]